MLVLRPECPCRDEHLHGRLCRCGYLRGIGAVLVPMPMPMPVLVLVLAGGNPFVRIAGCRWSNNKAASPHARWPCRRPPRLPSQLCGADYHSNDELARRIQQQSNNDGEEILSAMVPTAAPVSGSPPCSPSSEAASAISSPTRAAAASSRSFWSA